MWQAQDLRHAFVEYVESPSGGTFRRLREGQLFCSGFRPFGADLDSVDLLLAQRNYADAEARLSGAMWPTYLLSPGTHARLSLALGRLGQSNDSEMERAIANLLISGLETTGDGTRQSPIHVTRMSDIEDFLWFHGQVVAGRTLLEEGIDRLECVHTTSGKQFWFDLTDLHRLMRMHLFPRRR